MRFQPSTFCLILLYLSLISTNTPAFSQSPKEAANMYQLRQTVGNRYETIEDVDFQKQFYRVRKNGLYGLIDAHGNEVAATVYDQTDYFGLAHVAVRKGKKWGALNRKGRLIIPIEYDRIDRYNDPQLIPVLKDFLWAVYNAAGQLIIPFEYIENPGIEQNKIFGHIKGDQEPCWRDSSGNRCEPPAYHNNPIFGGNWKDCRKGLCALFNADGLQLSDYIFSGNETIIPLPNNRVAVGEWDGLKMYLYDYKGNLLYDKAFEIRWVNINTIWISMPEMNGFLHKDGRFIETAKDEEIIFDREDQGETLVKTYKKSPLESELNHDYGWTPPRGQFGWVDINSGLGIGPQFDYVQFNKSNILAYRNDTTYVYSRANQLVQILPFYARLFPNASFGTYLQNKKVGLIDTNFQFLSPPLTEGYERAKWGGIYFHQNWKYGLVNNNGREILPALYDKITPSEPNGQMLTVTQNGKKGIIDLKGNKILEPKYAFIESVPGGNFVVKINNKFGLIDKLGKVILPIEYDTIKIHSSRHIMLLLREGFVGLADFHGMILLPVFFESIDWTYNDHIIGKRDGLYGVWDEGGKNLMPLEYQQIERHNTFLLLRKNNQSTILDYHGKIQTPIPFDTIRMEYGAIIFSGIRNDSSFSWIFDNYKLKQVSPDIQNLEYAAFGFYFIKNGKIGLIDRDTWQEILPPEYDQLQVILRTKIFAISRRDSIVELIQRPGEKPLVSFFADSFSYTGKRFLQFWRKDTAYLYDLIQFLEYRLSKPFDARLLSRPEFDQFLPYRINRNFKIGPNIWTLLKDNSTGKSGCYNPITGDFVPIVYDDIFPFDTSGFMLVKKDGQCALFDPHGIPVSAFEFDWASPGNRECFIARKNGKYSVQPKKQNNTNSLSSNWFGHIELVQNCFVTDYNPRRGLLAPNGQVLLESKYNHIEWVGDTHWIGWGRGSKVGVIRTDGTVVLPFKYDWMKAHYPYGFIVGKGRKFGFANYNGKILIPFKYDEICLVDGKSGTFITVKNGVEAFIKI